MGIGEDENKDVIPFDLVDQRDNHISIIDLRHFFPIGMMIGIK